MADSQRHTKGFTVSHINARSILNKIDEVNILIHAHMLDVLTISKSWLHSKTEDICVNIGSNNLYRQDRMGPHITITKGGGLLTYVDKKYQVDDKIHSHLNCCNQYLEAQVIELRRENHKRAIIVNLYRPPSGN